MGGALAWGRDQDKYGSSSEDDGASSWKQAGDYGYGSGHGAYGYGAHQSTPSSHGHGWGKGGYGTDHDSRYGKSYDAVHAKSYNEQNYLRHTQADDDRWAVDEDTGFDSDEYGYGNDASAQSYRAPQAWGRTY